MVSGTSTWLSCRAVSVPFRGFRGLQGDLLSMGDFATQLEVSVPFRGFRGLQVYIAPPLST